jgi:hypothetical protein
LKRRAGIVTWWELASTIYSVPESLMNSSDKPSFPKLPDKLREDLKVIAPSGDGDLPYLPCAARMRDGTVLVCRLRCSRTALHQALGSLSARKIVERATFPCPMLMRLPRVQDDSPHSLRTSFTRAVNLVWATRSSQSCFQMAPDKFAEWAMLLISSATRKGKSERCD